MRIHRISVDKYGPLRDLNWELPSTGVVYDDNMAGKTALVDLIVRYLFVPRKRSRLFQNYSRFSGNEEGQVRVELRENGNRHLFGTEGGEADIKELFGWEEEGLFRLFCIRAGDNRLVTRGRNRSSVFNAAASLISGLGTEKLDRIKKDMESEFRITRRGNWSNRKGTQPPKIKERINEEILPFLNDFSASKETLHEYEAGKARLRELQTDLDELEKEKSRTDRILKLLRAEKLERRLNRIETLEKERTNYARIKEEDLEKWRDARAKLEKFREQLSETDHSERTPEEKLKELKNKIKEAEKLQKKELEERINALQDRKREKEREINAVKREARENKRKAIDFLQGEIRAPLKEVTRLEERRNKLEFWYSYRRVLDTAGAGLFLLGLLTAFFSHPYFGLTALPGLVLTLVTRRKLSARANLTQEISDREKEVTRKFNSKFSPVLDGEVKKKNQMEAVIDLVPDRVEEQLKQEENIEEIKSKKDELEEEINRLKLRSEELPKRVKELRKEKKELAERISRAKQRVKEARNTLAELRDRTNLPDLASLKEKLTAKKKLEEKLRDEKATLAGELDSSPEDAKEVTARARETIVELQEVNAAAETRQGQNSAVAQISRDEARERVQKLNKKIERKSEEVKNVRSNLKGLRKDLSERGMDPTSPAELFRKKQEARKDLKEFIIDRVSGNLARKVLEDVSQDYLDSLDRFISGDPVERTVQSLFQEVMGEEFELSFNYENNEFRIKEGEKSYPESDLSSGGRKHLFLATRLGFLDKITKEPGFLVLDDPLLFYHEKRKRKAIKQLKPFVEAGWQVIFFSVDGRTRDGVVEELGGEEYSVSDLEK